MDKIRGVYAKYQQKERDLAKIGTLTFNLAGEGRCLMNKKLRSKEEKDYKDKEEKEKNLYFCLQHKLKKQGKKL